MAIISIITVSTSSSTPIISIIRNTERIRLVHHLSTTHSIILTKCLSSSRRIELRRHSVSERRLPKFWNTSHASKIRTMEHHTKRRHSSSSIIRRTTNSLSTTTATCTGTPLDTSTTRAWAAEELDTFSRTIRCNNSLSSHI